MINIEELYKERDKVIRNIYDQLFQETKYTIWDGVFSPLDYAFNPFRVLFINREPYDSEMVSYNVVHTIRKQITMDESFWTHQINLKQNIRDMLAVFSLMKDMSIQYLSNKQIEKHIDSFRESNFLFKKALFESAYINIKKSDGKNESDKKDLFHYAQKGLVVLKKQISFFNPSIIVGGNIVDGILEKTDIKWGNNLFVDSKYIKVFQLEIGDKVYPFIDSHHLSAISFGSENKIPMRKYYEYLVKALKAVVKKYPGYWEKRRNLPVFRKDIID